MSGKDSAELSNRSVRRIFEGNYKNILTIPAAENNRKAGLKRIIKKGV